MKLQHILLNAFAFGTIIGSFSDLVNSDSLVSLSLLLIGIILFIISIILIKKERNQKMRL